MGTEFLPGGKLIAYPQIEPLDSSGRVRVSHPFNIFNSQFNYGLHPLLFEQLNTNGSVVHIPAPSIVRLSTGGGVSGNGSIFQSKRYFRYLPSRAHQIIWTCVLGEPKNNAQKTIGYYDKEDGLAFVQDGSGIGVLRRTSTSGTPIDNIEPQSSWNLDPLDGSGRSGVILDVTKDNIYVIDFLWLGAGRIRYGFDFGGHVTYVHEKQFANTEIVPFMRTANLPFRAEIKNTGVADGETTFDFMCVAINSEGGAEPVGLLRATSNAEATGGATPLRTVTSGNQPLPILSIRARSIFNGLINRGQARPVTCEIVSRDAVVTYSIILNGILTGASFADVNSDSIVQVDVSATSISGGTVVNSGYIDGGEVGIKGAGIKLVDLENIILSNNIMGNSTDILSVVIQLADTVSSNCGGAFVWKELF